MFKTLVMLKVAPWFLYADNEADALKTCEKFKDNVSGVVLGKDLIVKHPRQTLTLEQEEVKNLPAPTPQELINPKPEPQELEADVVLNMEESIKELDDEFDKLQSSIDP